MNGQRLDKAPESVGYEVFRIDAEAEAERIVAGMRSIMRELHRRGCVVAISGGVDSAVCAALCVRAFGPEKVYGLLLPEKDASDASTSNGRDVAEKLGIDYVIQNITPVLEAIGCYAERDRAMRAVFPQYGEGWVSKIVRSRGDGQLNHFRLVVQSPNGHIQSARLSLNEYLLLVAATNYKQRIRKNIEYFHADRLNYAVIGTPNRLEFDQGFFVKNGDGAADIKPIAHLYKTQVYQLADYLEIPKAVCRAAPTTDTYSMVQGQDEFYFGLPYHEMDLALWADDADVSAEALGGMLGTGSAQAEELFRDIRSKRRAARYQHAMPRMIEVV